MLPNVAPERRFHCFKVPVVLSSTARERICTLAIAVAFVYFDVPRARRVYGIAAPAESLARGFASAVLLGVGAVVALALVSLALVIIRIMRGHLSPFREATVLACLTSIVSVRPNAWMRFLRPRQQE
jgi:hypothetical protein